MDAKGIIGTGWYPVKLRVICPGPVTLLNDIMRYIISIRILKFRHRRKTVIWFF
jgi:hypothetical protein